MKTIREVLDEAELGLDDVALNAVETALLQREDEIAESLLIVGAQTGVHAPIIADVFANQVPLGTPKSEEERILIRQALIAHLEELRRRHEGDTN